MTRIFRSERLIYRAAEPDEDLEFFTIMQKDEPGYIGSTGSLHRPQGKKGAEGHLKYICEEALLGVVICLPEEPTSETAPADQNKPKKINAGLTPIGVIHLNPISPRMAHHRYSTIGIDIHPDYQRRGYGTEAITWITNWAFDYAGLHRVQIGALGWNPGARDLYARIGFKLEATCRQKLFTQGKFWDTWDFAILEDEWRELQKSKVKTDVSSQ